MGYIGRHDLDFDYIMEENKERTPTDLLHELNKVKGEHEAIKSEIQNLLDHVGAIEKSINSKLERLEETEQEYVKLMQELMSKQ